MKTIYKSLIILLSAVGLFACNDDFMDRSPLDKINETNYWTSVSDLKLYSNQFYPVLWAWKGFHEDNGSDNQGYASRSEDTKVQFIWNEYPVPQSGGGWAKGDWSSIRSCNFFLQNYHTVKGSQESINIYLGEVLFFKSLYYFDKVVQFGDVPWLNTPLDTDSKELYAARDSRKLVMDSICANLDKAIGYLPETSSENRVNKYAALALKARICLFEGTFRKYHGLGDETSMLRQSANAAWAIISSHKFELYSTGNPAEDYRHFMLLNDKKGQKEAILYRQFEKDLDTHNTVRQCREGKTGMTKDFVESYLCTDGLPIGLSSNYKGDMKFDDEFTNRDPRMKQTIYTSDQPIFITEDGEYQYENTPTFSNTSVYTGYRIYKVYSPTAVDNEFDKCTIDDCIFRYAEILLIYAEAKAELGECDQAVLDNTINLLRKRSGMPDMIESVGFVDPNWPQWEVPVSPLINEIRRERRIELACEGFRFSDLRRWKAGKLLENPKTYLGARDPQTNDYRILYPGMVRKWNDKLYLYPIPSEELVLNPNLAPQNSGW